MYICCNTLNLWARIYLVLPTIVRDETVREFLCDKNIKAPWMYAERKKIENYKSCVIL